MSLLAKPLLRGARHEPVLALLRVSDVLRVSLFAQSLSLRETSCLDCTGTITGTSVERVRMNDVLYAKPKAYF